MKVIQFIKTNSYNIFKMLLNQIGLSIFAFVMSLATYQKNVMLIACCLIAIGVYLYLLYTMTYEIGRKDKPAVDAGRKPPQYGKGLFISLCANFLNIILAAAVVISMQFLVKNENYIPPESRAETEMTETGENGGDANTAENDEFITTEETSEYITNGASYVYTFGFFIITLFESMYFVLAKLYMNNPEYAFLLFPVPALLTCWLAYYMGLKGKRLLYFIPEKPIKPKYR